MNHVLITRSLTDSQQQLARTLGLRVTERPVLHHTPRHIPEQLAALLVHTAADAWLFTSANATRAVANVVSHLPHDFALPAIFCIGERTAAPLQALGLSCLIPEGAEATQLATMVSQMGYREPVHFCGRDRRAELRSYMTLQGLPLQEVILYEMVAEPLTQLPDDLDALAVLSPRSVAQLPEALPLHLKLCAIGDTTLAALQARYPAHTHLKSPQPTLEALLHHLALYLPTHV
jgi:uroporphyrinogen-III synthase